MERFDMEAFIRGEFEEIFSAPPYEFDMARYGDDGAWPGNYRDYHVQCAYCGFTAALKLIEDCENIVNQKRMGKGNGDAKITD